MKKVKKAISEDKYIIVLLSVIAFVIYSHKINVLQNMYLTADEFSLFAIGAYLNGMDWSGVISQIGYYSFGFPVLFIAPFYKIFSSFSVIYKAVAVVNCIIASLIVPMTYLLAREWGMKKFKEQPMNVFLVLVPAMSGCVIAYSTLGLGEVLLILLAFCITYLITRISKRNSEQFFFPLLSFLSIYMFFIHQRSLGILLSLLIVMIVMLFTKVITIKQFSVYAVFLLFFFIIGLVFKRYIQNNLWNGGGSGNDFEGILPKILLVFSRKDILLSFLRTLIGQLFYMGLSSFGLLYYAFYEITGNLITSFRRKIEFDFSLLFLLLAFLSTFIISTLFMAQPIRSDQFLYGRYNDIIYLILLLYALINIKNNKTSPKIIILILWVIMGLLTYNIYIHYYKEMPFMKFNVINLSLFYTNEVGKLLIYSLIIIMVYIMVLVYKGKYRLLSKTIGVIVMMIFSYESAKNFTNERIDWSNNMGLALKAVSNQMDISKNIYFSDFSNGIAFLQTEFPKKEISQYQGEQDGYLVVNHRDLFTPQILNLSKDYIGTIESASVFSLGSDSNEPFNLLDIQMSQFDSDDFISDLSPGFLVYGPYVALNAGNYFLEVELELYKTSTDNIGFIDISDKNGTQIIYRRNIETSDFNDKKVIFKLPFRLEEQADAIEFRVYTNEGVKLKAKSLDLEEKE